MISNQSDRFGTLSSLPLPASPSTTLNMPAERKSKFKGKRPGALNLEAAKQEIGIGDGAEHRLTPVSPGWARLRFALDNNIDIESDDSSSNNSNTSLSPPSSRGGNAPSTGNASGLHVATPTTKKRPTRVAKLNLSGLSSGSKIHGCEPFDFAKRLREDYRRRYV